MVQWFTDRKHLFCGCDVEVVEKALGHFERGLQRLEIIDAFVCVLKQIVQNKCVLLDSGHGFVQQFLQSCCLAFEWTDFDWLKDILKIICNPTQMMTYASDFRKLVISWAALVNGFQGFWIILEESTVSAQTWGKNFEEVSDGRSASVLFAFCQSFKTF